MSSNSYEHASLLQHPKRKQKRILPTTIVLIILTFIIYRLTSNNNEPFFEAKSKKKNVIFFVSDGMGPASLSLTRSFRQYSQNLTIDDILTLDKHLIGTSRTRSSDSLITDSAAGATAFSCALKTYNSACGIDSNKNPCGTLLEAAHLDGLLTGMVVTTRITDATPAAFSSHVAYRFQEDLIAEHQLGYYPLGRSVDLIIGGGRTHFYSTAPGGSRKDGRNLIEEAIDDGWQYVGNREQFDQLQMGKNVSLPLLALLADGDIPFDLDRDDTKYPSLEEQTLTALKALSEATEDSDKGFFLLVEGSRIDHAGHQNDPSAQVREVLAFDKAFNSALEFINDLDTETIILSTSDHETGGLVTARQVTKEYPDYVWYPSYLNNAKHSGEFLKSTVLSYNAEEHTMNEKEDFVRYEILENFLGIHDYQEEDVKELATMTNPIDIQRKINYMISYRAQIGWTTEGHSAVDVYIYGYSNRKTSWLQILENLQGNHENIEIGQFIKNYLKLDLDKVTKLVKDTDHSPKLSTKEVEELPLFDEYMHQLKNN